MTRSLAIAAIVFAATVAQQTRDSAGAMDPAGTGVLAGTIVEPGPPTKPVRGAIVTLTAGELPRGRATVTDDDGRFQFERLPAGRFSVTATKGAYLPAEYGASRPGRAGVPLQLAAGQRLTDLKISMGRGAAITGTLREPSGEPVANVRVAAFRVPPAGDAQTLMVAAIVTTDDRGMYRVFGLTPGSYVVCTTLPTGGRVSEVEALPAAEVDRSLRDLRARAGLPVLPSPAPLPPDPLSPGTYSYAPIFHPSAIDPAQATPVKVGLGEERTGIDILVQYARMSKIQGTLQFPDASGPTIQFAIRTMGLRLPSLTSSTPVFALQPGTMERAFTYSNVAPSRYAITVRTRSGEPLWGRVEVDIANSDVTGVAVALRPALKLSGKVVFEGSTPRPDTTTISVSLTAANGAGGGGAGTTQLGNLQVPSASVDDNGLFEMTGVIPDRYRLTTSSPGGKWWLKSAVIKGRDVLDVPFDVDPTGDTTGAVLTFSDKRTMLSGTLLTASGAIAPTLFIAVMPADRALWHPGARRIQFARSGTDGRWILKDLPPGEYLVAALTDLDPDDLRDSSFLESISAAAVKVSLTDGEARTLDLKIGG